LLQQLVRTHTLHGVTICDLNIGEGFLALCKLILISNHCLERFGFHDTFS